MTPIPINAFQTATFVATSTPAFNNYQDPDVGPLTKLNGVTLPSAVTPPYTPENGNQGQGGFVATTTAPFLTDFGHSTGNLDLTGNSLPPDSYGTPLGQPLGHPNVGQPRPSIDQYGSPLGTVLGGEVRDPP